MCVNEIVFELRRRGRAVASVPSALRALSLRGLVRGPLSRTLAYQLTADGWDISRPQ